MMDELKRALSAIVYPALKPEGFTRSKTRDLVRVENGIVQRLYFQVSAHGDRTFCVTACANLLAGNEMITLQPGFRIKRDIDGSDLWLPSETSEQAEHSAVAILAAMRAQALPYFENTRTLAHFSAMLAHEQWGSAHHLDFQRAVAAALAGDNPAASRYLDSAVQLYEADGRSWCASYVERAKTLQQALDTGRSSELLSAWGRANSEAHGIQ